MIICPNCHHNEAEGAIFCSECGSLLEGSPGLATLHIQRSASSKLQEVLTPPPPRPAVPINPETAVSLSIVDSGQIIPLEDRDSFSVGRSAPGQPILPDIDLSPYHAYENGVSRLHASIQIMEKQILITDLGSVNGSRVNGQKIPAHKPFSLSHGDIITLVKLKMQILVHRM